MNEIINRRSLMSASSGPAIKKLASGTYTLAADSGNVSIPVTYSGTALYAFVKPVSFVAGVQQTGPWAISANLPNNDVFNPDTTERTRVVTTSGSYGALSYYLGCSVSATAINIKQQGSSYPIKANNYIWEIWGVE